MSDKLIFFNKEGDYLNTNYNSLTNRYEADLIFHENSSDTFKTIGLYTFEKKSGFSYDVGSELYLEKFQLFNEHEFTFTGNKHKLSSVTKIETTNYDSNYHSKWIYGKDLDIRYPIGTKISFDTPFAEFLNPNKTYTVLSIKRDAILILSEMDNLNFYNTYGSLILDPNNYIGVFIKGRDIIGIKNYKNSTTQPTISDWSEPTFEISLFEQKKLNVVGGINEGIYTVKNINLLDSSYSRYYTSSSVLQQGEKLVVEVHLKNNTPLIYKGTISTTLEGKITFTGGIPSVLKPGYNIKFGTGSNTDYYTISDIISFEDSIMLPRVYEVGTQVMYNGDIYECVEEYTYSLGDDYEFPSDSNKWISTPNYVIVDGSMNIDTVFNCDVYLYNEVFIFEQEYINNGEITLGLFEDNNRNDFKDLNITVDYNQVDKSMIFDLDYDSKYVDIIIKSGDVDITNYMEVYERNIEVVEPIQSILDDNISEQYQRSIIFENIDEFGIKVSINGMYYEQEQISTPNKDLTVHRTISEFVAKYRNILLTLGVEISHISTKGDPSYSDTLLLKTTYPNVPLEYDVTIGDNGFYYIRHSSVVLYDIEQYLIINIDGVEYSQLRILDSMGNTDVSETISEWIDNYHELMYSFGIFIYQDNTTIYFNKVNSSVDYYYTVSVSKSILPNENNKLITNYLLGNVGTIITSNSIKLLEDSEYSFIENDSFSNGMLVTINNSLYPFVSQQYNILYADKENIILSYQGPFWGDGDSGDICINSPFVVRAFDEGFERSLCDNQTIGGGDFDEQEFNEQEFNISNYVTNSISTGINNISNYSPLKDIAYINNNMAIYILGDEVLLRMDSTGTQIINTIAVDSSYDTILSSNQQIFLLSDNKIMVIDINTNNFVEYTTSSTISRGITYNNMLFIMYDNNTIGRYYQGNLQNITVGSDVLNFIINPNTNELVVALDNDTIESYAVSNMTLSGTPIQVPNITHYLTYEPNENVILVISHNMLNKIDGDTIEPTGKLITSNISTLLFDNVYNRIVIVDDNVLRTIEPITYNDDINLSIDSNYNVTISSYDGYYYLYDNTEYKIYDPSTNEMVIGDGIVLSNITKMIYNPLTENVMGINAPDAIFTFNSVVESTYNIGEYTEIDDNRYGTLAPDYIKPLNIWLKVEDYVRYPRENYVGDAQVEYIWKWEDDTIDDIFLYDFSGEQLADSGPYKYVGEKPLNDIRLNRLPNKDISRVTDSKYQQTIFRELVYKLDYNNSGSVDYLANPLEVFIGFNSTQEGVTTNKLNLIKRERVSYDFHSDDSNFLVFETIQIGSTFYGRVEMNNNSMRSFLGSGLKVGQLIKFKISDVTNKYNNYTSLNNGVNFRIYGIFKNSIIVEYLEREFYNEETIVDPYNNNRTYLDVSIIVQDDILATFNISGQTEIEDIRYKSELGNSGKLVNSEDIFIFKEYDINESGVDWVYMNKKRLEMLMVKHDIFSYVGSYKAIINAINYFGYNDLELYEYYRNINIQSDEYGRLTKVEIPDIFNNSIRGWNDSDFIKQTFPNINYEVTNLFNLTYRMTDTKGNNIQMYSIDEVIIKLQGLKKWLQKNVVPITHELFDITGRGDTPHTTTIIHQNHSTINYAIEQNMSPINVSLSEAYLMPVNSGSTVYNIKVDFYTKDENIDELWYDVVIRTYKTYNEWEPFGVYNKGDKVTYYQQVYESNKESNKVNDPRKYQDLENFNMIDNYIPYQKIKYNNKVYQWLGDMDSHISHVVNGEEVLLDSSEYPIPGQDIRWKDITEWIPIDYEPVQTIREYKGDLSPTNITIDTNIDPFITVEVQSDNGYGMVWTTRKNYEVRSLTDLTDAVTLIEIEPLPDRY